MWMHINGGRVKWIKYFWASQFTQQALRKHFSCHDSITMLRWWGDGEEVERKKKKMQEDGTSWETSYSEFPVEQNS